MAQVVVIAHAEVKPGSADKVKSMLQQLKKDTHEKESHRHSLYEPVQDPQNENKFCVHERWNSTEDLDAHMQEKHVADFVGEVQQHLISPEALTIARFQII